MAGGVIRVYLSFDYNRDLYRVQKIHDLPGVVTCAPAGFKSISVWEQAKRRGDVAVKGLINDALNNTSVSVFCLGHMSGYRKFMTYEIEASLDRGNGIVGLLVNHLRDQHGHVDPQGYVPDLIRFAGYEVYKYTDKRRLVQHIHEALEISQAQRQQDYERRKRAESSESD